MLHVLDPRPDTRRIAGVDSAKEGSALADDTFARQLQSLITGGAAAVKARIATALEKMAGAFPGATISSQTMTGFNQASALLLGIGAKASITIAPEIAAAMAENEAMAARIQEMVANLFSAGRKQTLTPAAGNAAISRTVSVQTSEVRYVEVHRNANGGATSLASLSMQYEKMVSDTLNSLMADRDSGSRTKASGGFEGIVRSSANWRFEGMMSTQSASFSGLVQNANLGQFQLQQNTAIRMSVVEVYQEWSTTEEGGQASGVDLFAYLQAMGLTDPLVLDLDGEGINLTSAENGVYFDIKGDGSPRRTAFIQGGNAFLYQDANANGVADDANELFGDHGGFANGFAKLAQHDVNGDGQIDADDPAFQMLRLWRDLNRDGINQAIESLSLEEAGIQSLDLRYADRRDLDLHGNVIGERSSFTRDDGSQGLMADVWLRSV